MFDKIDPWYAGLQPHHKEIIDNLDYAEFVLVNNRAIDGEPDHDKFAHDNWSLLFELFDDKNIRSLAPIVARSNWFDQVPVKGLEDIRINAYRLIIKKEFEKLSHLKIL